MIGKVYHIAYFEDGRMTLIPTDRFYGKTAFDNKPAAYHRLHVIMKKHSDRFGKLTIAEYYVGK